MSHPPPPLPSASSAPPRDNPFLRRRGGFVVNH